VPQEAAPSLLHFRTVFERRGGVTIAANVARR
jgi:hypothetical protein